MPASAPRAHRRRRLLAGLVVVLVVAVLTTYLALAARDDDAANGAATNVAPPKGPVPVVDTSGLPLQTSAPPWDLPLEPQRYITAAQLVALPREVLTVHYHAHLDIIVDGRAVVVPSGIGYIVSGGELRGVSALHTHDINGLVHVESAQNTPFTLGQLFAQWGVRLTSDCMGGMCNGGGKAFKAYVDGEPLAGDPSTIVLRPHQEIALWYGDASDRADVPDSYEFGPGD